MLYRPRSEKCISRGWMFLGNHGGPCDKKCRFCYYAYQKELTFFDLDTLRAHANAFRFYYGLDACDITGGEPTLYPELPALIRYCRNIGLAPTIITHGQNLHPGAKRNTPAELEDAGLFDYLVSLHGDSPASHDACLCEEGAYERLTSNLKHLRRPVRFNCTVVEQNVNDLPLETLRDRPPTVLNLIWFNPFHYWSDKTGETEVDFQVTYSRGAEAIASTIEVLEALGWEVNVRYFPLCIAQEHGFAKNVCGYHQVPWDPWEWRLNVTARTPKPKIEAEGGWEQSERKRALEWMQGRENVVCRTCALRMICDKPPPQYQAKYGLEELTPVDGKTIRDPLHFQRERWG